MKKILYFSSLAAIGLSLLSCSSEEINDLANDKVDNLASGYVIPLEEAIETAQDAMTQLFPSTRAGIRNVSSVETLGKRTRSTEDDAIYYIINYENNGGFAIIGGDKRQETVYALSDEGSINLSDTASNNGLKLYLDGLPKKIKSDNINGVIITDPVRPQLKGEVLVPPMLTSYVRNWNQIDFNKYVRQYCNNNLKTPVGCAVVATAQILSHFKHPKTIVFNDGTGEKTYNFNWDVINSGSNGASDQIARLFQILGSKDYLNVKYSTDTIKGTTCDFYNVEANAYYRLGYEYPTRFKGFLYTSTLPTATTVIKQLKEGKPVQLTGNTGDVEPNYPHCWVVDGLAYLQKPDLSTGVTTSYYYYHFVWGNSNKNNGYYRYDGGTFDGNFESYSGSWAEDEPGGVLGKNYRNIYTYMRFTVR